VLDRRNPPRFDIRTSGKDAHYQADRSNIPIKQIKLDDLRRLVVEWYEKLDDATRALVPLKRYYWPVGR
jgi:restriction system protein